ncbi:hypothetical protein ACIBCU_26395 [Streptomyces sp. NPDC051064]|uniref:hypothetical protein n=1 Tax=Streptomyces sp. NPDC051064 TaxID=3365641 RepID=UPI0037BA472B
MSSKWPIPRPTENRALRALNRTPRELPAYPELFASLMVASRNSDRRGCNRLGHLIARVGGEVAR